MGHPWRQSLHLLWYVKVGGPGVLLLSSHRSPAAQGMVQTAVRERLSRHLIITRVSSPFVAEALHTRVKSIEENKQIRSYKYNFRAKRKKACLTPYFL